MCLLMNKAGEARDMPVPVSFDAKSLVPAAEDGTMGDAWAVLGDAALASLDPLCVLEDAQAPGGEYEWYGRVTGRCGFLQFNAPQIQVSRAIATESKVQQWNRLRPAVSLHCLAEESNVGAFIQKGLAVLRRDGSAVLPPRADAGAWPPVVLLDRCNAERVDRRQWLEASGLKKSEVIAVHLDVPSNECINRVARRGDDHPTLKVSSLTQAAAAVHHVEEMLEPPSEHREGFKSVVQVQLPASAVQDLVRRWTEPVETETDRRAAASAASTEDPEEAPPPPLPYLNQWIEVEEQSGRRSAWSGDTKQMMGSQEPHADSDELEDILGSDVWRQAGQQPEQYLPRAAWEDPAMMDTGASSSSSWSGLQPSGAGLEAEEELAQEPEDAEEWARQEQLAATLRCMGFDEEPSLQAAQRAGGNLNRAVEDMLHRRAES
eukprot:gb/GFBE01078621.1/.p1 GENE.gb/GFBE01078621.1/~~gb/GFBE01078621.1/.p1  ORF type:complete len:433 (+),score=105.55 gb/GFBE01078621.1/:1-1299(+)